MFKVCEYPNSKMNCRRQKNNWPNYKKREAAQKIEEYIPEPFKDVPRKHTYSIGQMMMFITLVLKGISMRCAAKAREIFFFNSR